MGLTSSHDNDRNLRIADSHAMKNSISTRSNDKRMRLIEAADKLFHQNGVVSTTLANIADLAKVPLGNVYYYFKSKESIILAVIAHRRRDLQSQFEQLNTLPDGKSRLQTLIRGITQISDQLSQFGDALGSLCQELGKQGGSISEASSQLMRDILKWCEEQFIDLGKGERAPLLASNLVSSLQGISLLTLTFKEPSFTQAQSDYLIEWLDRA